MSDRQIVLATGNPGKCREIRQALGDLPVAVVPLSELPVIDEPVEDGATFADNARLKALYYAAHTGHWALADDSGLVVDALGGAPGVHSARFAADRCPADAGRDAIDRANNTRLLDDLHSTPDPQRTARFVCHLALADPQRVLLEACGTIEGQIGRDARGENGFGYDPLFVVPELGCTTAELPPEAKNAISHRGQAVKAFRARLADLLKSLD